MRSFSEGTDCSDGTGVVAPIEVEGNLNFYNRLGFVTSSEFGIYSACGRPLEEPQCMMCMETYEGALRNITEYIVYDMYFNA